MKCPETATNTVMEIDSIFMAEDKLGIYSTRVSALTLH